MYSSKEEAYKMALKDIEFLGVEFVESLLKMRKQDLELFRSIGYEKKAPAYMQKLKANIAGYEKAYYEKTLY